MPFLLPFDYHKALSTRRPFPILLLSVALDGGGGSFASRDIAYSLYSYLSAGFNEVDEADEEQLIYTILYELR